MPDAPRKPTREGDMSPEDVAALDRETYEEPGRDLLATKPADEGEGGGARGDVDNPRATPDEKYHYDDPDRAPGSDELQKLGRGKGA